MTQAITNATQNTPAETNQIQGANNSSGQKAGQTPAKNLPKDTVTISNAAQTAAQELQETQAQTIREAESGDHQAQRLLAKETTKTNG